MVQGRSTPVRPVVPPTRRCGDSVASAAPPSTSPASGAGSSIIRRPLLRWLWAGLGGPVPVTGGTGREGLGDGDRRWVTAFFVDLVDSSHLATRLDPEDTRDVLRTYQGAVGEVTGSTAPWPGSRATGVRLFRVARRPR